MIYHYNQMLPYVWDIPTTRAEYKEFDPWCPWCNIHHTCPSGFAWVKFAHEDKMHLCRVEMVITRAKMEAVSVGPFGVSAAYSHIDRRKPPYKPRCSLPINGTEVIEHIGIGVDRPECCSNCWDKRI